VTSYDSGCRALTEVEEQAGWSNVEGILYSPRIVTVDGLHFQVNCPEFPGFDEWYTFPEPRRIGSRYEGNPFEGLAPGRHYSFVNMLSFALHDPDSGLGDLFWKQMAWVQPESYLSDAKDHVTLVTRDNACFNAVRGYFEAGLANDSNRRT
jgi:hypothetical protein